MGRKIERGEPTDRCRFCGAGTWYTTVCPGCTPLAVGGTPENLEQIRMKNKEGKDNLELDRAVEAAMEILAHVDDDPRGRQAKRQAKREIHLMKMVNNWLHFIEENQARNSTSQGKPPEL